MVVRKYCLFCRTALTPKNATNEHVVPQWVLREFGSPTDISPAGWRRDKAPTRRVTPGRDSLSATFVRSAIPDGFRTSRMP